MITYQTKPLSFSDLILKALVLFFDPFMDDDFGDSGGYSPVGNSNRDDELVPEEEI